MAWCAHNEMLTIGKHHIFASKVSFRSAWYEKKYQRTYFSQMWNSIEISYVLLALGKIDYSNQLWSPALTILFWSMRFARFHLLDFISCYTICHGWLMIIEKIYIIHSKILFNLSLIFNVKPYFEINMALLCFLCQHPLRTILSKLQSA